MKNVIVIGGGTAGWLTALSVNKFWKDASVTLIESSKIGILGAGEGGTPNFGAFLSLLGINQNDFYKRTGCTSKIGLTLTNWTGDGKSSSHLFTGPKPNEFKQNFAYHFDARMVAEYLKEISLSRGVKWIDGEVDNVDKEGDDIHSLSLKDGTDIKDIDFIFDCSGFARIIIGKVHNEEWIDYSKYLLLNRAIAYFLPQENQYSIGDVTHTNMISMNSGWMWQIPLQHRWGCGYTFNSEFITVDEAKKEVEDYIGKEITIQKVFDFKPGTHKRSWIGNSVAIGLSYGFIEPLEATSLMSTIMQLRRIISAKFDVSLRDRFNDTCSSINEQNMMFVRYHYLAERFDTPFWKTSYEMPIPEKLQLILDADNNIIPKTNAELLKIFDLKEVDEMELTFFTYNYQMIFKKNKKVSIKELI